MIRKTFDRVLLLGCIERQTADEVRSMFDTVDLIEPAAVMAKSLEAKQASDVELDVEPGSYDLLLSLNTIAETNDPLTTLMRLRFALAPGGLLLGTLVGGESLPILREAMRTADRASGVARPHVHPRIDPAGLTQLLAQAGLSEPVVDIDRVEVRYGALARLVDDLRKMGTTNFLMERDRGSLDRTQWQAASSDFVARAEEDGKVSEIFDLLHFAGWQESAKN